MTKILHHPNPVLKTVAAELDPCLSDADFEKLKELVWLMRDGRGIGLAAPQIGWSARAVAILVRSRGKVVPLVLVNPRIVKRSIEVSPSAEGCLSIPGVMALVPRHEKVSVEACLYYGEEELKSPGLSLPHVREFEHLESFCVQHEIDHLDGILMIDRATEVHRGA